MKSLYKLIPVLALSAMLWNCDEDTSNPIPPTGNMVLNVDGLTTLPSGWLYEAWLKIGTETYSAGQFNIADGETGVSNLTVPVMSDRLENADGFFISIESTTDGDPDPSASRILGGTFGQYEAELTHQDASAIGADLSDPGNYSGAYLVAAPTSATLDDDTSGIWFIDNSSGAAAAGLALPTLNSGWVYEGWVVIDGTPVSTGRFSDPGAADQSCTYCGPMSAPPFPGEDFLANAPSGLSFPTNLSGRTAVISVEPEPDYSPDPYDIKILAADIPSSASIMVGTTYSMDALTVAAPSGNVLRFFGFNCNNGGCE